MEPICRTLKALVEENRLRIISLLQQQDLCVGALAKKLDISEAAVSQHLKILRESGFVAGEKRGYFTHYRVINGKLKEVSDNLLNLSNIVPDNADACSSGCCRQEE